MANQVEIEVVVTYEQGQGLARAEQQIRADANRIASELEATMARASSRAAAEFSDFGAKVNRELQAVRADTIDIKVNVDDTEVRQAEGDIRDLDSIPPPEITPRINAAGVSDDLQGALEDAAGGLNTDQLGGLISGKLSTVFAAAGPVIGAIAATWGDDLAEGIAAGFNRNRNTIQIALQTGLGREEAGRLGGEAGEAYSAGFGDSMGDAREVVVQLQHALGEIVPTANMNQVAEWAITVRDYFGIDIPTQAEFAGRAIARGLVDGPEQAWDLLITLAQDYGARTEDVLAITDELGGSINRLGLDFADAAIFAGEAWEKGLVSTIDRGAEALEEFLTRITDGDSREAIEGLGLSFDDVVNRIAQGGPVAKQAVQDIVDAFIASDDAAAKAAAANQVFGTSLETASDIDAFVEELDRMLQGYDDTAGKAKEAADATGELQTEWDKASRVVQEFGGYLGELGATHLNSWIEGTIAAKDAALDMWSVFATGEESTRKWQDAVVVATEAAERLEPGINDLRIAAVEAAGGMDEMGDATAGAEDEVAALNDRIAESIGVLNEWAGGQKSGAEAIQGVREAVADLDEETLNLIASQIKANGEFNLMSEEGQQAAIVVSDVRGKVADLTEAVLNNEIGVRQYNAEMRSLQGELRATLGELGLTEAQVDAVTEALLGVPSDTNPSVVLDDQATKGINDIRAELNSLNGKVATTYVDTVRRTYNYTTNTVTNRIGGIPIRAAGGDVYAAAGGGLGVPVVVNDGAGQEMARLPSGDLVDLPAGSTVMTAEDSQRIRGNGDGGDIIVNNTIMGSVLTERDLMQLIRDALYRGGFDGLGGAR